MSNLSLNSAVLPPLQYRHAGLSGRVIQIEMGLDTYTVGFYRDAREATHTHPEEPAGKPEWDECAAVIGRLFTLLLNPAVQFSKPVADVSERSDGPGPDFEGGWNAYRSELAETTSGNHLPEWKELPSEVQEAWCVGMWHILDEIELRGDSKQIDGIRWIPTEGGEG